MGARLPPVGLAGIVRLLRPYARGEGSRFAAGAGLGLAAVLLHVARPWPLKWLVDLMGGHGKAHQVPEWVPASPGAAVALLSAMFVVLALCGAGTEYAQSMLINRLGNRVLFRFRSAVFEHLLRQPLAYHEGRDAGELLTRVVSDTSRLRRGVNSLLMRMFQTVALFAASLAVMVSIEPYLGLVLAGAGALAVVVMRRGGGGIARSAKRQRKKEGVLAGLVASELASVRELQLFGPTASAVMRRFAQRNNHSLHQEQKVLRKAAGLIFQVDVLIAVGVTIALSLGAMGVMAERLTPGDLVLFLSYALALRHPCIEFATQTTRIGRTYACAERLARIATRSPEVTDAPHAQPAPVLVGALQLRDVAVKAPRRLRGAHKWTLRDLSCELPAGRRTAIIGGNGAGKSTLLRLIPRLADPDSGQVFLDGRDLREYTLSSVRDQVSVVFQDAGLPGLPVRDVIALGRPDAEDAAVVAAAKRAHAHAFIKRLPQGYGTIVRRRGELFSGGERQRLAIAAALLRDGRIWLLDEPTSGLDLTTGREMVETLLEATEGRTTLWVTHDPDVVRRMDGVLVLKQGQLAFAGTPESYLERRERAHLASGTLLPLES